MDNKGKDEKDKIIPGKLKNPFEGQDKGGINKERKIPGKLKQKFGETGAKEAKPRKQVIY